jgi:hypothetical protein
VEKSSPAYAICSDTFRHFNSFNLLSVFLAFHPLRGSPHGLLIVENDFAVVGVLKPRFEAEDQAADWARNTEQSMSMLRGREYHAAIVDLDLPEGLALVRQTTLMNGPVQKLAG